MRKLLFLWLGVVVFATSAFAAGINVHCTGTAGSGYAQDHNGSNLNISSVIQWVYGNPGAPDPNVTRYLHSGNWQNDYNIGAGTAGQAGTFDINTSSTSTSFLRIWENGGPAQGNYYRTLGGYPVGDPLPNEVNIGTFQTNYLADIPPAPTVTAGGWNLTWDDTLQQYLVAFSLTAHAGSGPPVEVTGWAMEVRKESDSWAQGRSHPGGSWSITEDPNSPYFIAGQNYVAHARATNYFGTSAWGPDFNFTIPTGGGGGGTAGPVTYFLRAAEGNAVGLNAVSVVHNVPFNISGNSINNVADLTVAVNSVADADVVTAVGKMVDGQMVGVYVTYDNDGNASYTPTAGLADAENTTLVRGESWQISVSGDVDVTFTQ